MKDGKYGFFIAAIVMLVIACFGIAIFAECCSELASEVGDDGHEAAFAALIVVIVGIVIGGGNFFVSALGILFSAFALKRAERTVYRVTSIILCVFHSIIVAANLLPTLFIIFLLF